MGIMIFHGCLSDQVMEGLIDVACLAVILALTVVLVGTLADKFEGKPFRSVFAWFKRSKSEKDDK